MKQPVFLLAMLLLLTLPLSAQDGPPLPEGKNRERLEQLRRIKLIEALELNEEQAVRLSVREKDFREKQKDLMEKRQKMADELRELVEDEADDAAIRAQLAKINEIGVQMVNDKHAFLLSLNDFLSMQQIAKIVLFEQKFSHEVRRLLENARKPQRR